MTGQDAKSVQVQYYASLREERGLSDETITTTAHTPEELYTMLQSQHHFSISQDQLKVAINNAFQPWDCPLKTADHVVFIPPVSGG